MAVNSNDRYEVAVTVSWLRRCQEDEIDQCYKCPFDGNRCISSLQLRAAELLEKFAEACEGDAEPVVTWLRNCCQKGKSNNPCLRCPFNDGEHNCQDWLHEQAADLLERLAAESKRTDCHSSYGTSQ